jgi:hypothetical protein
MHDKRILVALAALAVALIVIVSSRTGWSPPRPVAQPVAAAALVAVDEDATEQSSADETPVTATLTGSSENPLLDPNATMVAPEIIAVPLTAQEKRAMADELRRLQARHPYELVTIIASATADSITPISPSLLLSIAYTETHGKVLAVSPAGAAGLAQATPAAFLMEGFDGPLYLTNDYLIGTRAFIMKKPLGDAVVIAERVVERKATHAEALELVRSAKELRRVGIEELEALAPRAPEIFMQRVEAADRYNEEILDTLERMLARGASRTELAAFRDDVRKEYRSLLRVQQETWKRYAASLERERNQILRDHFRRDHVQIILQRPYEAGEVLGEKLDARFSPSKMARFLETHLMSKRQQAIGLGIPDDEIEAWTAALYNGGLVNITRMRAGLMPSIRETQNYMHKVPALRQRLDGAAS